MKPLLIPMIAYYEDFHYQLDLTDYPNAVIPLSDLNICLAVEKIYQCFHNQEPLTRIYMDDMGIASSQRFFMDGYLSEYIRMKSGNMLNIYRNEDLLSGKKQPRFSINTKDFHLVQYIKQCGCEWLRLYSSNLASYFTIIRYKNRIYRIQEKKSHDKGELFKLNIHHHQMVISTAISDFEFDYKEGVLPLYYRALSLKTGNLTNIGLELCHRKIDSPLKKWISKIHDVSFLNSNYDFTISDIICYKDIKIFNVDNYESSKVRRARIALVVPIDWDLKNPNIREKIAQVIDSDWTIDSDWKIKSNSF